MIHEKDPVKVIVDNILQETRYKTRHKILCVQIGNPADKIYLIKFKYFRYNSNNDICTIAFEDDIIRLERVLYSALNWPSPFSVRMRGSIEVYSISNPNFFEEVSSRILDYIGMSGRALRRRK